MDAGHHAVRLGTRHDVLDGLLRLGVEVVKHRLAAQRERQIRRPDVDRVQAFDREDRIQVVERLRRLDHGEGDDGLVGVLGIVGAAVQRGADGPEAARALRRVVRPGDQLLRVFSRVDHRADDSVGPGVQRLHQDAGLEPGHTHDGHRGGGADGLQHGHQRGFVDQAVLHVDGQRVPALVGHELGAEAVGDGQPAVDGGLVLRPQGAQAVLSHGRSPVWVGGQRRAGAAGSSGKLLQPSWREMSRLALRSDATSSGSRAVS